MAGAYVRTLNGVRVLLENQMINKHRLMMLALVSLGVACNTPNAAPTRKAHSELKATKVFYAPASKASQEKLGVVRWHLIMGDESGSVVIDGADANGKVRFSSSIRRNTTARTLQVDSYTQRGSFAINTKTSTLSANNLPASWNAHATAFAADWKNFHAHTPYGVFADIQWGLDLAADVAGGVRNVALGVAAIAAVIPGGQAVADRRGRRRSGRRGRPQLIAQGGSQIAGALDKAFPDAGEFDLGAETTGDGTSGNSGATAETSPSQESEGSEGTQSQETTNDGTDGNDSANNGTESSQETTNDGTDGNDSANNGTESSQETTNDGTDGNDSANNGTEPYVESAGGTQGQGDELGGAQDNSLDTNGGVDFDERGLLVRGQRRIRDPQAMREGLVQRSVEGLHLQAVLSRRQP